MSTQDNGSPEGSTPPTNSTGNGGDNSPPQNELPRWATKRQASTPFSDERMAAYIGPRWESTYRAKLTRFFIDPAFTPTWNWAAALGWPFWFLYRKLYLSFVAFVVLPNVAFGFLTTNFDPATVLKEPESPEAMQFVLMSAAVALSTAIAAGGTANWFLFRRARAASLVVSMQQVPEDVAISRLQRLGGVSLRPVVLFLAFSLIFSMVAASAGAR